MAEAVAVPSIERIPLTVTLVVVFEPLLESVRLLYELKKEVLTV